MQVVILCGGRGTRMLPATELRPKPLVPIGSRPLLWHVMSGYARHGHTDFVLCLGYKADLIRDYFLSYPDRGLDTTIELGSGVITRHSTCAENSWTVTLADTGLDSPTGARIKRIQRYVVGDTFFVTYADGLADIDVASLLEFHQAHGKTATVTTVYPPARFDQVRVEGNRVVGFSPTARCSQPRINGGFFVFDHGVFDVLSDEASCALEREPMAKLIEKGQLVAYEHNGFWQCADTLQEVDLLSGLWERGNPPWVCSQ